MSPPSTGPISPPRYECKFVIFPKLTRETSFENIPMLEDRTRRFLDRLFPIAYPQRGKNHRRRRTLRRLLLKLSPRTVSVFLHNANSAVMRSRFQKGSFPKIFGSIPQIVFPLPATNTQEQVNCFSNGMSTRDDHQLRNSKQNFGPIQKQKPASRSVREAGFASLLQAALNQANHSVWKNSPAGLSMRS